MSTYQVWLDKWVRVRKELLLLMYVIKEGCNLHDWKQDTISFRTAHNAMTFYNPGQGLEFGFKWRLGLFLVSGCISVSITTCVNAKVVPNATFNIFSEYMLLNFVLTMRTDRLILKVTWSCVKRKWWKIAACTKALAWTHLASSTVTLRPWAVTNTVAIC